MGTENLEAAISIETLHVEYRAQWRYAAGKPCRQGLCIDAYFAIRKIMLLTCV